MLPLVDIEEVSSTLLIRAGLLSHFAWALNVAGLLKGAGNLSEFSPFRGFFAIDENNTGDTISILTMTMTG